MIKPSEQPKYHGLCAACAKQLGGGTGLACTMRLGYCCRCYEQRWLGRPADFDLNNHGKRIETNFLMVD